MDSDIVFFGEDTDEGPVPVLRGVAEPRDRRAGFAGPDSRYSIETPLASTHRTEVVLNDTAGCWVARTCG